MHQIAIYGKGGIGKSTISSNLSAAYSRLGMKVMHVGCDPKRDSTRNLVHGRMLPTVLDTLRLKVEMGRSEDDMPLDEIVHPGFNGVACIEAGGPEPGIGCAGRGVMTAIMLLDRLRAFDAYHPDMVLYVVLGDVVCGGFAQPIREGFARAIYLVCSAQFMSIYAANNIARAIVRHAARGGSRLAGVIHNHCSSAVDMALLDDFAGRLGTIIIGRIPRSVTIQKAETQSKTVIESYPDSAAADAFRQLATANVNNAVLSIPTPVENRELEAMCHSHLQVLED